ERERARRRYQKRLERAERARRTARRRQLIAVGAVAALVLVGAGAVALTAPDEGNAEAAGTDQATATASPDQGKTSTPSPLPTTNPKSYPAPPPPTDALGTDWQAVIHTNHGDIAMTLNGAEAPQAVASFLMLAGDGFFEGTACHRLLPDSLLQCGDPTATGTGGPGYTFG